MSGTDWTAADATARAVLLRHGGAARIGAFLAAGLSRYQVAAILRRRVVERPRIAWFVDPDLPWRAKHAIRVGGVLDCVSAAETYGLPVPPEAWRRTHVRLARNTPRLRHHRDRTWQVAAGDDPGVELHWTDRTDAPDASTAWRTSAVDALRQLAECVPDDWFVAAIDAALHAPRGAGPLLSSVEYVRLATLLPRRLRRLLRLVDARSESPIETLLRLALVRAGIGPFDLQVQAHPAHRVDIVVRRRLVLEADGAAYHDPEADAIRDALLRALGYEVLRFSYDEIVFHIDEVVARVRAALALLG